MGFLSLITCNWKVCLWALVGLVFAGAIARYWWVEHEIEALRQQNTMLQADLIHSQAETDAVRSDAEKVRTEITQYAANAEVAAARERDLQDRLYRELRGKHSMEFLAAAHPGMVEKSINESTQKVFKCVTEISGMKYDDTKNCFLDSGH